MVVFNICKVENGIIYYCQRPVGIVRENKALVLERCYCKELENFLQDSGYRICWVYYEPEELKRAV
ncbi:hypothetical protein [Anaerocellum danielii]|uniref:Uncharacterized protein n=1 Tax=Anaerocellum danielii TaxID=1387557 RepID=A0ABZ0TZ47_9FIRM|nr:hypothetical protein [Caldicellulosiruptor danielii]WPX08132.1 hypothetical protein SOJ16_001996 [Caldicellulosiruptor danielii]